jgi:hypothetical protein
MYLVNRLEKFEPTAIHVSHTYKHMSMRVLPQPLVTLPSEASLLSSITGCEIVLQDTTSYV